MPRSPLQAEHTGAIEISTAWHVEPNSCLLQAAGLTASLLGRQVFAIITSNELRLGPGGNTGHQSLCHVHESLISQAGKCCIVRSGRWEGLGGQFIGTLSTPQQMGNTALDNSSFNLAEVGVGVDTAAETVK